MKLFSVLLLAIFLVGCDELTTAAPTAASGIQQTSVTIKTGSDGLSVEQRNVKDRLLMDNKIGSIKHLYIISAYSGQCLIYSTVKGKVTSSGKRLTPSTLNGGGEWYSSYQTTSVGKTPEVLGDDGTYGSSMEYVYWWDTKGIYHQHYIQGGQIVHVSDQPMPIKSVTINMELAGTE